MYGLERKYTISLAHFREYTRHIFVNIPAHTFSWNSRLLKVQKYENKQNFDYNESICHKWRAGLMASTAEWLSMRETCHPWFLPIVEKRILVCLNE